MTMGKSPRLISASDVGKAAYCPHSLSLQKKHAYSSNDRQRAGTKAHAQMNDHLLNTQDSRCYIATHALGANDPDTQALRDWRDRFLMPHWGGRSFVNLYYWLSPYLIQHLSANSLATRALAFLLRKAAARVKP